MIRTIARGLLVAVLAVACSDVDTTAPLVPSTTPRTSLGLQGGASADTIAVGESLQLSTTLVATMSAFTNGSASALRNGAASGCLAVVGGPIAGSALALAPCVSGSAEQTWTLPATGAAGAVTAFGGALCLDNWGARGQVGDRVGTWACVGGAPTQTFTLQASGELQMANGLCVQAHADGSALTLQTCNGASTQRWFVPAATGGITWASSHPAVATVSATGLVTAVAAGQTIVTAMSGTSAEVATIVVTAGTSTPPVATGEVALQGAASGLCLSIVGDRAITMAAAAMASCVEAAGQRWTMKPAGTPGAMTVFGGTLCLDDWGGQGRPGDRVGTWSCVANAPTQTFTLTTTGELRGVNGLCLQAGAGAGVQATLQSCTGAADQRWTPQAITGTVPQQAPPAPSLPSAPPAGTTPLPGETAPPVTSTTPELPRVTIDTRMPTQTGREIAVPAGGDLQAALNAAQPGDVITLANGATYRGNFVLAPKAPGSWIIVRPASMSGLPAEGERLAPSRHAGQMPKIVSPNGMFAIATPDAYANTGTHGWRFVGIEIASNESQPTVQTIVELGHGAETSLSTVPSHFILDRVWIHGRAEQYVPRCLTINSAHTAVIDSYLSDCHTRGGEGQVIAGWTTPGPVKIENNYLEGGTIGVLFGGADPMVNGVMPSDIEVRGNHFLKPLSWRGVWSVKNSFELKNAQRVLVEGNVFENNWMDAQAGYMILFTPLSQGNQALWTTVRDVTFRHNLLRNSAQGFMISARNAYGSNAATLSEVTSRILITNNVLERVGGRTFMVYNETRDVTIANNSVSNSEYVSLLLLEDPTKTPAQRLVFRDNLVGRGYMMLTGDGTAEGRVALEAYARDAVIAGNLAYSTVAPGVGRTDLYPTTNNFVPDAGLAGITSGTINGIVIPNIAVSPLSAFFRSGTGGTTPGADLAAVARATANAVQQ